MQAVNTWYKVDLQDYELQQPLTPGAPLPAPASERHRKEVNIWSLLGSATILLGLGFSGQKMGKGSVAMPEHMPAGDTYGWHSPSQEPCRVTSTALALALRFQQAPSLERRLLSSVYELWGFLGLFYFFPASVLSLRHPRHSHEFKNFYASSLKN